MHQSRIEFRKLHLAEADRAFVEWGKCFHFGHDRDATATQVCSWQGQTQIEQQGHHQWMLGTTEGVVDLQVQYADYVE